MIGNKEYKNKKLAQKIKTQKRMHGYIGFSIDIMDNYTMIELTEMYELGYIDNKLMHTYKALKELT